MRKATWLLALALAFLLGACGGGASPGGGNGGGGGGDGGNGGGGEPTVTVTAAGAKAAAYRIGNGAWEAAADPTSFSFTVSGGGPYDVALRCNARDLSLYSLTTDELTDLDSPCDSGANNIAFSVDYDVSGVQNAKAALLFHKGSVFEGERAIGTSGTFKVTHGVAGEQDLVVLALDGNNPPNVLAAKMATFTVADKGSYTVPALSGGDSVGSATFPDFSGEVPSGYKPAWTVFSITPKKTAPLSGFGENSGGTGSTYFTYPFADYLIYMAGAEKTDYSVFSFFASASGTPAITLPGPIDPAASGSPISVSGLVTASDLLGYVITASWNGTYHLDASISKAYLGSDTSYTLPDLSSISGFENTKPATGDTVNVSIVAMRSNMSIAEFSELGKSRLTSMPAGRYLKIAQKETSYKAP